MLSYLDIAKYIYVVQEVAKRGPLCMRRCLVDQSLNFFENLFWFSMWFKVVQGGSRWFKVQSGSRWFKVDQGSRFKVQSGSRWFSRWQACSTPLNATPFAEARGDFCFKKMLQYLTSILREAWREKVQIREHRFVWLFTSKIQFFPFLNYFRFGANLLPYSPASVTI